ncbi:MAG: hypothetical protein FWC43_04025 [Planctomycetaceae bacterium]|nr:hypothetical protein [Planctomycetaceae bacterium]
MKHYSQHHLKVAATEPEHVVRKAEFDVAVGWLDERIVMLEDTLDSRMDGPVILQASPPFEIVMASDTVESPQTSPICENVVSLTDDAIANKPLIFQATLPSENVGMTDTIEPPPCPIPAKESANVTELLETVNVTPFQAEGGSENLLVTDNLETLSKKEPAVENCQLQGEIEVIVEDQNGTVKSRQVVSNAITDGFLRYAFYDMMNGGALANTLRSNIRTGYNLLSRVAPTNMGIYAMDRDIEICDDTFVPPYKLRTTSLLDPGVVFYNIDGSMTETSQVMIPVDQRCYFDHTNRELVVEYIKNTGSGSVKSICVGAAHNNSQLYSVTLAETAVPDHWKATATGSYLVEHHATNGTYLWKTVSATGGQYRFNLKNRMVEDFSIGNLHTNITNASVVGGVVVSNHIFKAIKQAASGTSYTVRLNYLANFRSMLNVAYKDIILTTREGMTVRTDTHPVMVYRTDTNQLEIFVAMSFGQDVDASYGFNIYKVTVSGLGDPATMTTKTDDLGFLPYAISNHDATGTVYVTGYFDGENYYLPYNLVTHDVVFGQTTNMSTATFQYGVVISEDFKKVERIFNMRSTNTTPNLIVRADTGLLQCQAALTNIPYIFMSQVVSGTNLPKASVKEPDDVLRIIYRYKIG